MRKSTVLIFMAFMLVFCAAVSAGPSVPDDSSGTLAEEYTAVAENQAFEMYVNVSDCQIAVREKASGREWLSCPNDSTDTEKPLLTVSFLDTHFNIVTVNSFSDSIEKDTYEVKKVKGGLKITFDFQKDNQQFRIPVQITISDEYVEASILYDDIEEYGESRITNIDLLPFFGAGHAEDDGYLFIPDGSGALIRFSDNSRNAASYRQRVFGTDPAVDLMLKSVETPETVSMPVFGIKKNDGAFLAVIHEGASAASVYARNSSFDSPFASVGCSFIFHQYDVTGVRDKRGEWRQVPMTQEQFLNITPKLRYYFLDGENANYSGMARKYRDYLTSTQKLTLLREESSPAVSLMLYGQTKKQSSFLGIPITKNITATSFSDAQRLLKKLDDKGISNPNIFLYGFEKGGYQQQYTKKESFNSGVGGKKGYQTLLENAGEATIYQANDLSKDYKSSFFKGQYIRSLNRMNIERRQPMISSGEWDFDGASWRYLKPDILLKNAQTWIKSITKADNAGVLFSGTAQSYSDFEHITDDNKATGREHIADAYRQALDAAKKKGISAAVESGNNFGIGYADVLVNSPTASGQYDIVSEDIPFYAMVFHGYVQMTSKPVNRMSSRSAALADMTAAGIQPSWQLTAIDPLELKGTQLKFLYNTKAGEWTDEITKAARMFEDVQKGLANVLIESHARQGSLEIFTYENGTVLVGNNGDTAAEYMKNEILPGKVMRLN